MDQLDKNFTGAIIKALQEKLERTLSEKELQVFTTPRSLVAYEMMLDYIKDNSMSKESLEKYANNVILEYNTKYFNS
ncbi:hypothetical protein [Adhaeribacter pallidiroseus]|uniref:Uncharacterized protein n=1 Tax=Adhaeribacter pallidiroseus TaxID=2072847 RepID=A0A369QIQ3_9BACT|nr:hypothetical protein [Adhaeribacter pallidiroseus]RDC64594.1 hypothetical protein AHMF7616_03210 [Adhaeribacter pallidiroseus]